MKLVVYSGTSASGKDTAGDFTVATRNAQKRTLSDIIRQQIGAQASNTELREAGNELRANLGDHILAKLAYVSLQESRCELGIIVSVRHPAEAIYLQEKGADVFWFDAPLETRYLRYSQNSIKSGRPAMSLEAFTVEERLQYDGDGTGYSLRAVQELVLTENHVWNDFVTVKKLHKHIDALLLNRNIPATLIN